MGDRNIDTFPRLVAVYRKVLPGSGPGLRMPRDDADRYFTGKDPMALPI